MAGEGIAEDIIKLLEPLLARMVGNGDAADDYIVTTGDSSPHQVLNMVNRILPAFTIVNIGSATVTFGAGGIAKHQLPVGASYTYRWKNPMRAKIVINDGGTAATIDVMS